ncbi:MAG: PA2169 family four-helix-bundle protein [Azoarcus sp.]|nr:PA2169 family four-helix-bundle protein [Azoarcus sp.]
MDTKESISVLNNLIETCKDGEAGFTECAQDVESAGLKTVLIKCAHDCSAAATELQRLVHSMGGEAENDTSLGGDMHRRWVGLKDFVTGKDDKSILNECERGEDVAKKSYKEALEKHLPPNVRAVVEKQHQGVLQNHDKIKALRDAARKQAA